MRNLEVLGDKEKYLLLTMDVEEDMPCWVPEKHITVANVQGLPRFQKVCDKYGIKPTYLTTYAVADNRESANILVEIKKASNCEIGAHLHPWNTPPVTKGEELTARFLSQCNAQEITSKMRSLTQRIEDNLRVKPKSFRGGRFGFNEDVVRSLLEEGYEVDSSVTPYCDWSRDGGPDFQRFSPEPFIIKDENQRNLREVPVTIAFDRRIPASLIKLFHQLSEKSYVKGILNRLKILRLIWLRPTLFSVEEMRELVNVLLQRGIVFFNMMFHSSELWPGASPYCRSQAEVDSFFIRLEGIFSFLAQKQFRYITLKDIAVECLKEKNLCLF